MSHRLTGWRRIADAMWDAPDDPQIYGAIEIDATNMNVLLGRMKDAGHRVSPTHVVGRALAHALHHVPDVNVRLVAGRAVPRESVDIFFVTAVDGGRDLTGVKVERADEKSVIEVADELTRRARAMKQGSDPDLAKSKRTMEALPKPVLRLALRLSAWISGDLGRSIRLLGLAKSPFGSAMVTSVGMFGLPMGFAPIAWMYKVPILVLVGELTNKPIAVDGRVEIRPILPLTATIDHRYADGWHISQLLEPFRAYLEAPASFEPEIALPRRTTSAN